jgi:hypothetical protein
MSNDDANPYGMERPKLQPASSISEGLAGFGEAISEAVRNMGTRDRPRTRPVLPIHERNRPTLQAAPTQDDAPPKGMPRPRLPLKDPM